MTEQNGQQQDVFKEPQVIPRPSGIEETILAFDGCAFYIDRILMGTKGSNVRITFMEQVPDTNIFKFRTAVAMPIEGLMQLQQLCNQLLNDHFNKVKEGSLKQALAQQQAAKAALEQKP